MPNTPASVLPSMLAVTAGGSWLLAVWLLTTGAMSTSENAQRSLLSLGVVAAVAAIGTTCVLMIRTLIDDAVRRCVNATVVDVRADMDVKVEAAVARTAVQVGGAIASALRDECTLHPELDPSVPRLYTTHH